MTDITDSTGRDTDDVARSVFAGLVPAGHLHAEMNGRRSGERSRVAKGMFATGSVLLVGSVAAMSLNLTGPIEPASAKQPPKPKGAASDSGRTVREAIAASTAVAASTAIAENTPTLVAPASYRVAEGDTISSIAGRYGLSTASVLALNGLGWSSLIFPGQELKLGSAARTTEVQAEVEAPAATPSGRYTIVAGDTIGSIAQRYGVSTLSVLSANNLGWSSIIYPGQTLLIPGLVGPGTPSPESDPVPETPAPATPVQPEAALPIVPVVSVAPIVDAPPAAETTPAPVSDSYTIASGDTVGAIAARFGISIQDLLDANGMDWSSVIYAGHSLVIPGASAPSAAPAPVAASTGGSVSYLTDETRANAAVIIQVGRELGVPDYGIVIALATAMQESSMRNINWGDLDSVGLFQQRPSAGWGSVENLTTPSYAARLFYGGPSNPNRGNTRGLLDISGWQSMPLTEAAQRVQISAYPDAYAKWEASARSWLAELG